MCRGPPRIRCPDGCHSTITILAKDRSGDSTSRCAPFMWHCGRGGSLPAPELSESPQDPGTPVRRRWWVAAGVLLVAAGIYPAMQMISGPGDEAPKTNAAAVDELTQSQPAIAILPFVNLGEQREQEFFADGITDDLITDLSRIPGLLVISRTSSFAYKGRNEDIRQIAEALGARYVVEGSARRAGEKLRINIQLTDAQTGHHLWADRYDSSMSEFFELQNAIARRIAGALDSESASGGSEFLFDRDPSSLEAYDVFVQGSGIFQRFSRADTFRAREYFEQAIEMDPGFSRVPRDVGLDPCFRIQQRLVTGSRQNSRSCPGYCRAGDSDG